MSQTAATTTLPKHVKASDLRDLQYQLCLAVERTEQLLNALPARQRRALLARMSDIDFDDMSTSEIASTILFTDKLIKDEESVGGESDSNSGSPKIVAKRNVKARLLADKRLTQMSAAVNAESKGTLDEKKQLVLRYAQRVIDDAGKSLSTLTPGFASGKHWAPVSGLPTTGSAAYSRYNTKYYDLGYVTLVPLYIDERPVSSESIWSQRKDDALEIEKFLHRSLGKHALYEAREGGSEPKFSKTTKFYVYLALK